MAGGHKPAKHCGAKTRSGSPCRRPAGWGTDHHGVGRCKLHGGATPIKHGLYSTIARGRTLEVLRQMEAEPVNDAAEEIRLAMAQVIVAGEAWQNCAEEGGSIDPETGRDFNDTRWSSFMGALDRLIRAKQREAEREQAISKPEFMDFLQRLLQVVETFVPEESWGDCRRAVGNIPVWRS